MYNNNECKLTIIMLMSLQLFDVIPNICITQLSIFKKLFLGKYKQPHQ